MTRDERGRDDAPEVSIDSEVLDSWSTEPPPADFADRVLAARGRSIVAPPAPKSAGWLGSRKLGIGTAMIAVASAAVVLLALARGSSMPAVSGELQVDQRREVKLGHRGVAVLEPGAHIQWQVDGDGHASITQHQGEVFYRVERGGGFVVHSAAGRATVTGTSFSVEAPEMNRSTKTGLVGAAAGALLVVTVYEGRVLLADKHGSSRDVTAGQVGSIEAGEFGITVGDRAGEGVAAVIDPDAPWRRPPSDDATREQLLARDQQLREQVSELERSMALVKRDLAAARRQRREAEGDDGRPWFDPGPDTLKSFVDECRVRFDAPDVMSIEPRELGPETAAEAGMDEATRQAANEVMKALHREWLEIVRGLYVEVTGDTDGANSLSAQAMANEIMDKSPRFASPLARKRIAEERAGLARPPADWSQSPPVERYFRHLAELGDKAERRLGDRIGAELARDLRGANGGWGNRMEMAGCARGAGDDDAIR